MQIVYLDTLIVRFIINTFVSYHSLKKKYKKPMHVSYKFKLGEKLNGIFCLHTNCAQICMIYIVLETL